MPLVRALLLILLVSAVAGCGGGRTASSNSDVAGAKKVVRTCVAGSIRPVGTAERSYAAVVQEQPAFPDDGPERRALRAAMERASALVRHETFPAVAGDHCRDCEFKPVCPIQGAGSVTSR